MIPDLNYTEIISYLLASISFFIIITSLIKFLLSQNIFNSINYIITANIYGVTLMLIALIFYDHQAANILKIIIIIILNLIISIIVSHNSNKKSYEKEKIKNYKKCQINF